MKSLKLLISFSWFCFRHPELRFWQSLRAWSGANKIYFFTNSENLPDGTMHYSSEEKELDTYYWNHKDH